MASKQPLEETNIQGYTEGQGVKKKYPNAEIHLDHIPSKKAIELAYLDTLIDPEDFKPSIIKKIHAETTTLARAAETHRQSPTSKINVKLAHIDKDVLALAAVRDLEHYKIQELERGVLSPQEIDTAMEKVHQRNYDLGIYTKDEVNIANTYTQKLQELQLNKHVDVPSFEEVAKEYHAHFEEAPRINTELLDSRLSKPSIIVGATLASMVFTDKADASTIHLNPHMTKDSYESLSHSEQIGANIGAGFNALNAIQAHEEFKAGASKSASTLLDPNAYKQGLEIATDAWKVDTTKEVVKLGAMDSAKVAGKSLLKKLPLVGLGAGIAFGVGRAMEGDWKGASMEVASGAFSLVPGVGTAASVAMDAALLEKDTGMLSHGVNTLLTPHEQKTETTVMPTLLDTQSNDLSKGKDNDSSILKDSSSQVEKLTGKDIPISLSTEQKLIIESIKVFCKERDEKQHEPEKSLGMQR